MNNFKFKLRSIAVLLVVVFASEQALYAAPDFAAAGNSFSNPLKKNSLQDIIQNPGLLDIPLQTAMVHEFHKGTNGKLLIHIQDPHANFSGQKSIAGLIEQVMDKYGLTDVLVEGGDRDVTLDGVKGIASAQDWRITANRFLYEGIITGPEYLNLVSDKPMRLLGIEYGDLYDRNLKAYSDLADQRNEITRYLHRVRTSLDRLKGRFYTRELRAYEAGLQSGSGEAGDIVRHFSKLTELGGHVPLGQFPQIRHLKNLRLEEKTLDFAQVNRDQQLLFNRLKQGGHKEDVEQAEKVLQGPGGSDLAQLFMLNHLLGLGDDNAAFGELLHYRDYLQKFGTLRMEELLVELELFEDLTYKALLPDGDARKVRAIDRWLGLLEKAYAIKLSSREFKMFVLNRKDFGTLRWEAFINDKLAELGYKEDLIPYGGVLKKAERGLKRFYRLVDKRDVAFMANTERWMRDRDTRAAVFVAGGYHTEHLTQMWRDAGYSYMVLTPRVDAETDRVKYEKILLEPVHLARSSPAKEPDHLDTVEAPEEPKDADPARSTIAQTALVTAAARMSLAVRFSDLQHIPRVNKGELVRIITDSAQDQPANLEQAVMADAPDASTRQIQSLQGERDLLQADLSYWKKRIGALPTPLKLIARTKSRREQVETRRRWLALRIDEITTKIRDINGRIYQLEKEKSASGKHVDRRAIETSVVKALRILDNPAAFEDTPDGQADDTPGWTAADAASSEMGSQPGAVAVLTEYLSGSQMGFDEPGFRVGDLNPYLMLKALRDASKADGPLKASSLSVLNKIGLFDNAKLDQVIDRMSEEPSVDRGGRWNVALVKAFNEFIKETSEESMRSTTLFLMAGYASGILKGRKDQTKSTHDLRLLAVKALGILHQHHMPRLTETFISTVRTEPVKLSRVNEELARVTDVSQSFLSLNELYYSSMDQPELQIEILKLMTRIAIEDQSIVTRVVEALTAALINFSKEGSPADCDLIEAQLVSLGANGSTELKPFLDYYQDLGADHAPLVIRIRRVLDQIEKMSDLQERAIKTLSALPEGRGFESLRHSTSMQPLDKDKLRAKIELALAEIQSEATSLIMDKKMLKRNSGLLNVLTGVQNRLRTLLMLISPEEVLSAADQSKLTSDGSSRFRIHANNLQRDTTKLLDDMKKAHELLSQFSQWTSSTNNEITSALKMYEDQLEAVRTKIQQNPLDGNSWRDLALKTLNVLEGIDEVRVIMAKIEKLNDPRPVLKRPSTIISAAASLGMAIVMFFVSRAHADRPGVDALKPPAAQVNTELKVKGTAGHVDEQRKQTGNADRAAAQLDGLGRLAMAPTGGARLAGELSGNAKKNSSFSRIFNIRFYRGHLADDQGERFAFTTRGPEIKERTAVATPAAERMTLAADIATPFDRVVAVDNVPFSQVGRAFVQYLKTEPFGTVKTFVLKVDDLLYAEVAGQLEEFKLRLLECKLGYTFMYVRVSEFDQFKESLTDQKFQTLSLIESSTVDGATGPGMDIAALQTFAGSTALAVRSNEKEQSSFNAALAVMALMGLASEDPGKFVDGQSIILQALGMDLAPTDAYKLKEFDPQDSDKVSALKLNLILRILPSVAEALAAARMAAQALTSA